MTTIKGKHIDGGGRFAIVAARFNETITHRLVAGCLDVWTSHGIDTDDRVDVVWVPGAFELPLVAKTLAESGKYAAVVVLGAVIRGATPHFDVVVSAAGQGALRAGLDTGVPVLFGVLTTETIAQAVERSGTKAGNHGWNAGLSALEMASLLSILDE